MKRTRENCATNWKHCGPRTIAEENELTVVSSEYLEVIAVKA